MRRGTWMSEIGFLLNCIKGVCDAFQRSEDWPRPTSTSRRTSRSKKPAPCTRALNRRRRVLQVRRHGLRCLSIPNQSLFKQTKQVMSYICVLRYLQELKACLIDVGHVSVEATVSEANPTAKTALKAASTAMTASGDLTAANVSVNKLHVRRDRPICRT